MIHNNYLKLTDTERALIDGAMSRMFADGKFEGIRLLGDDTAEYAVEALATWVVKSRAAFPAHARG